MAILYTIKFEILKDDKEFSADTFVHQHQYYPPNLGPGTSFWKKIENAEKFGNPTLPSAKTKDVYWTNYIFTDEDALNNFCNSITMSESEKLSMEEWKEFNKIKISYKRYDIPESTIPAPAIFG